MPEPLKREFVVVDWRVRQEGGVFVEWMIVMCPACGMSQELEVHQCIKCGKAVSGTRDGKLGCWRCGVVLPLEAGESVVVHCPKPGGTDCE